jgi:hypothetical protein
VREISVFEALEVLEFSGAVALDRRASNHPEPHTRSKLLSMALVRKDEELVIKPEAVAPNVNYADWPLLLKNWDQRMSLHQSVIGRTAPSHTLRDSPP